MLYDSEYLLDNAPDSFSKFLTKFLISFMNLKKLEDFCAELPSRPGDSNFGQSVLKAANINPIVKNYNIPSTGQFISIVPVVSGIIEVVTSISQIIEQTGRDDIKILTPIQDFYFFSYISDYMLDFNYKSAISHLNKGGGIIYFFRLKPFGFTFDNYQLSDDLLLTKKLSKYTKSAIFPALIDYDTNLKYSWTTLLNDWFFRLFNIRRFFADQGASMSVIFLDPISYDSDPTPESFIKLLDREFSTNSIFNFSTKKIVPSFVPRGTK